MYLLVGLGNPGLNYQFTRHNLGFLVIDKLLKIHNFSSQSSKFDSQFFTGNISGNKIITIKPQTYMNCSGSSVQSFSSYYKIPLKNIIVFHDDIDLEFGKIKVKIGGGNAGHNGLKDIDRVLGKEYIRVRLGIGRPENLEYEISDYVLGTFSDKELVFIDEMSVKIADLLYFLIKGDLEGFMNEYSIVRDDTTTFIK